MFHAVTRIMISYTAVLNLPLSPLANLPDPQVPIWPIFNSVFKQTLPFESTKDIALERMGIVFDASDDNSSHPVGTTKKGS
jgi:hypothetical protein